MKLLPLILLAAHMTAGAAPVGEVRTSTGRIELHEEAGPCIGEARSAIFVSEHGLRIQGCWVSRPSMVFVVFFDGDIAQIHPQFIRKPTSL